MENSEHLQWIHDRMIDVHGEKHDVDYLIKLREIIAELKEQEKQFQKFMDFLATQNPDNE